MKKTKWFALLAAGALALLATGCDDGFTEAALNAMKNNAAQKTVAVEGVTLNAGSLTLKRGATATLEAAVTPENATNKKVSWSSDNEEVATVDKDGTVTAVGDGTATVTATTRDGGFTATCRITVKEILVPVQYVRLSTTRLTLTRGETGTLVATVTPGNADDTTVLWSSSNDEVATVDENGTVTAVKAGTATITATTRQGGRKATCSVTVNPIPVESITLSAETLTLMTGDTERLTATALPEDADITSVTWRSSDSSVAEVSDDGTVTAKKKGTATITVTIQWGSRSWEYTTATCAVTVDDIAVTLNATSLALMRDYTARLEAAVEPADETGGAARWKSSDESVAIVDGNGTVTAVAAGAADVTVTVTTRKGDLTATCQVTVADQLSALGFEMDGTTLKKYTGNAAMVVIPEGVISIGYEAFKDCWGLTSVTIPEGVTYIGWNAFEDCRNLTSVTIPESVKSIEGGAFEGCRNLTSVTIPDGVKSIEISAFYGCSGLTSVTIPGSVTSIGNWAFSGCSSLESVTIPGSVTSIGRNAFYDCRSLESVTIPGSVTYIGKDAFLRCSLETVTYTGTLAQWCALDVSYLIYAENVTVGGTDLKSMTALVIPDGVTEIKDYAFRGCKSLTSVTIPEGVTSIGYGAFYGCSGLTSVKIPDGVKSIGQSAFEGCSGLESVTIGSGVTSIGDYAFYKCSSLASVTIPDSVKSIGRSTFYRCTSLESVTIPDSVTSIGDYAFSGCSSLTTITYEGTQSQWKDIEKGDSWNYSTGDYTVKCTDGDIAKE